MATTGGFRPATPNAARLTAAAAAAATSCSYAVADSICALDAPSRSRSTIRTATVIAPDGM